MTLIDGRAPEENGCAPSVAAAPATIGDCTALARARLPAFEADLLTGEALGLSRATLHAFPERVVEDAARARLERWLERRIAGEPVAYILRRRGFWGLDLEVTPDALIPRPDTETLVAAALPLIGPNDRVLDVGTGSGAVALAIAKERPGAAVTATDIDPRCATLCRRNACRLGLDVRTVVADCLDGVDGRFHAIVSNPPYVAAADPHLRSGDLRFEPRRALVGGDDGLAFFRRLIPDARAHLLAGGWLALEHGCGQGPAVRRLFGEHGFAEASTHLDIENRPRATVARLGRGGSGA